MSLIKNTRDAESAIDCECQNTGQKGTFRMRIEPIPMDIREHVSHDETAQLMNAERIQNMFLPSLLRAPARAHGSGFHIHPEQPNSVAHVAQLHDLLDEHSLAARISFCAHDNSSAVSASLNRAHVEKLCAVGAVDVKVPLNQGTFRLHSTRPGRITAVEYVR